MKINWRWPATPTNDRVPWYGVVWRAPWCFVIMCGLGIAAVGVCAIDGPQAAKEFFLGEM